MAKNDIRQKMKAARAALAKEDAVAWSLAAEAALIGTDKYENAASIMLYYPLGNEVDTSHIAKAAMADGKRVIYPKTDGESGIITPITVTEDTLFERGAFKIYEPSGEEYGGEIDLVIVPGVAFDRAGRRIGFGKGCYDKFLENSSAIKVGLCYGIQLSDEIPSDERDVKMDMIVTESEILNTKKKNA